ncbi:MAG: glycosyltransferase family 2 protein [Xanthomonadaceae bacterium]|nr:glycosyltransferase family 2 protein [Xanthomonadaceae bacterium]
MVADNPGLTSVVIVAADSGADLGVCVERVLASTAAVEVIVSDNDSRDGSIESLAACWQGDARLRILRNGRNLGFGAGCNRGAAQARGDALLFLNPDCRIEADSIARLHGCMAMDIGLLGAAILAADGTPEPASRRRDPFLRRSVMSMSGLARFARRWPALAGVDIAPDGSAVQTVDAVSGATMLLTRAVFAAVGGFDEGYFLHGEDLDLCRRVRDAGWRVACANAVRIVHAKGTSSRARPFFVAYHKHRGMWRWFRKFDPAARNPLLRALVFCGLCAHYALLTPRYAWVWLRKFSRSR